MDRHVYCQFARIEDVHWWHESRRKLVKDLLSKLSLKSNAVGLDIGCGTGGSMRCLQKYCSTVIGLDFSNIALELGREKHPEYKFIQGDANKLSSLFLPETFDLVSIFNVLYHKCITNENNVLKEAYDILKPGGYLIVTEPAFRILWRRHDVLVMGKTRYRLIEFESMLSEIGFEHIQSTYFNSISFLPALVLAWLERSNVLKSGDDSGGVDELKMAGPVINKLMLGFLNLERFIIKVFKRIPVGVSLLSITRRPS